MKISARQLALATAFAVLATAAQASITSYSTNVYYGDFQFLMPTIGGGYYAVYNSPSGPTASLSVPYHSSTNGDMFTSTQATISTAVVASTPTYLEMNGAFDASIFSDAGSGVFANTEDFFNQFIYFTVDTPSSVSLYSLAIGSLSGSAHTYSVVSLDGTMYSTFAPSSVNTLVPIGAGFHTLQFEAQVDAAAGTYYNIPNKAWASESAAYDMKIFSPAAPEPASMAAFALGAIGILRRRRRA